MTQPELTPAQRTEVELLARGRADKSRVLRDLKLPETPEAAHALLLRLGVWDEARTPYADRLRAALNAVELPVPDFDPAEERLDLTHLPTFAIDDEGNQDPDDAVGVEDLGGGLTRLWVHVADVAALVAPDSPLDLEARARGATLYLPDRTIGMLPDELVAKAGLGLHEVSPALSICLDLDPDGNAEAVDVLLTRVKVQRLAYQEAQARLEAGEEPFVTLARLARASRRLREGEGALSIDLPEVRVKADETGASVFPLPKPEMRTVVQECMTLAGWGTAIFADDNEIPLPFATQDYPTREVAGDTLPAMWARRKTLARTRFQPSPGPHHGMGLDLYAQATSPMRRYLDLVVHQQLRAFLAGRDPLSSKVMAAHIAESQMNADATRQAERLSRRHHTLRFIAAQPERVWDAVVVDRRGAQATLLIPDLAFDVQVNTPAAPGTALQVQFADIDLPQMRVRARSV
ncbi:ribonuclease R family protein [Deinococcus radiodurans]|jgi:Exoribonuclease R|uniref:Ribonuclease II family protein n=2 Tax=Deinococcus radiodurans (strain ATCC 13939 / DSM 20539 / JCM 16871 / CCUG 27074 / LMG 4051 / NBRC 15346 / NCIMB 9279 / VKM B-1422 / R1) TaxID=243230 RepID=Q9RYD0_DEIRA|nr:ribonuclease R family protein [Deinococcus radiodurans]AAF09610.1 ribonuclease II family protein [Deinococcus radiodurans R1 = ATCC 13939 = DSM 20539]QEM72005.1 RNB domain-containing ribonuclease [Deinococcus radiodurans]QIP28274.1 VacB/RNase II family 3'-5' exoribonuclease [Deinococcus radiodurans]QIP30851.1 VacB/RNase II family 3'-5' exoribonuclease [Deinococcus radiodurans]UDK99236.1 RNB domain-containing ribonuclease [Deinococcus radiodurans R1 = ATCC 13939 = DSM 20539]